MQHLNLKPTYVDEELTQADGFMLPAMEDLRWDASQLN